MKTVAYVQRPVEVDEIDENSQQLVWLGCKPEPFEESDLAVHPFYGGQIVDLASAQKIIPLQKYASGLEVVKVIFVD